MKKGRLIEVIKPQNLQKQIDSYGYSFSIRKYILSMLAALMIAIIFGILFSLKWNYIAVIAVVCMLFMPSIILSGYKNMYEHKRFLDLSDYMEQVLYSFKSKNKILSALRDTQTLFTGKMNEAIGKAIIYIEEGRAKDNLHQEALGKIEEEYPNTHLRSIHEYLQVVEKNGGESGMSIDLLLKDKNIWADNILLLQEDKKFSRTKVFVALFITMGVAAAFHWLYRSMPEQYSILSNPITQITTTIYIILNIIIFCKANKIISKSWIEREDDKKKKRAVEYFKMIDRYDEKKERKKSLYWAAPFFIAVIPLLVSDKKFFALAAVVIGIFMLNQHKMGYRTAYNMVAKEINMAFPKWLMQLALLIQGNNIQNAIMLSIPNAPEILKPELESMINKLQDNPNSEEPYIEFLSKFKLSAVQSAMKMLYSISSLGSGEVETQVNALVERNSKLLDKAEKMENERSLVGITGLFYLPQVTISFQLMVTMLLFMMAFLGNTTTI